MRLFNWAEKKDVNSIVAHCNTIWSFGRARHRNNYPPSSFSWTGFVAINIVFWIMDKLILPYLSQPACFWLQSLMQAVSIWQLHETHVGSWTDLTEQKIMEKLSRLGFLLKFTNQSEHQYPLNIRNYFRNLSFDVHEWWSFTLQTLGTDMKRF